MKAFHRDQMFELMSQGIWQADRAGKTIYVNSRMSTMLGYTREEFERLPSLALAREQDRSWIAARIASRALGVRDDYGCELAHKLGAWVRVTVEAIPLYDADGKFDGTLAVVTDVTESTRAEKALRDAKATLEAALANMSDAVFVTDAAGGLVAGNEAFASFHRFAGEAGCGNLLSDLPPVLELFTADEALAPVASWPLSRALRGETAAEAEYGLRRKDTGETWVGSFNFSPIHDEARAVVGAVVVGRDVTERKLAERKLRDYQSRLQQTAFAEAMAQEHLRRGVAVELHDSVGQLLALAQLKLTALRETMAGARPQGLDEAIGLVGQSMEDVRTLTFELSPPVLRDLGLRQALDWLAEDVGKRYGLSVALDGDGANMRLRNRDAEALVFRAVRELLVNVAKHAGKKAARVSLRAAEHWVEVRVEDDGVGFDAADVARLSDAGRFGLFSVQEHLHHLGGTVDVVSEPGRGTSVTLRVPRLVPAAD